MSNRKFNLENSALPELSFRLLYITSAKYGDDWVSAPHSHYFTEIFYVTEGSGYMQIETDRILLQANSLIMIGPQVQHTEFSNPLDPLDYYVIGVEGLKITTERPIEYSVISVSSGHSTIRQCFDNILKEMHNQREGFEEVCQYYLAILTLLIKRKDNISYELVDTQNSSRECHKAKQYIEAHYHDKITLDSLSETCNLTKYYLSHKFTELYGKSPMAYLTEVRIRVAKDLLKTTNYSMEEISEAVGFSSGSYFSQVFQKVEHMSPQQYRKSHHKSDI